MLNYSQITDIFLKKIFLILKTNSIKKKYFFQYIFIILSDNLLDSINRKTAFSINKYDFIAIFCLAACNKYGKICLSRTRRASNHCYSITLIATIKPFIKIITSCRDLFYFNHIKLRIAKLIRIIMVII